MRGDPPRPRSVRHANPRSTPHARGSTQIHLFKNKFYVVYPACAGIHPVVRPIPAAKQGLPRMRGDPPDVNVVSFNTVMSTPHARGSTLKGSIPTLWGAVYPACAGIHRCRDCSAHSMVSLPRMRGDPPKSYSLLYSILVYPACADPPYHKWSQAPSSVYPHARDPPLKFHAVAVERVYPACARSTPSAYRVSTYSLSTRMRGIHPAHNALQLLHRRLPACAGIHHRKPHRR